MLFRSGKAAADQNGADERTDHDHDARTPPLLHDRLVVVSEILIRSLLIQRSLRIIRLLVIARLWARMLPWLRCKTLLLRRLRIAVEVVGSTTLQRAWLALPSRLGIARIVSWMRLLASRGAMRRHRLAGGVVR